MPQLVFPAFTINVLQPRRSLLDAHTGSLVPPRFRLLENPRPLRSRLGNTPSRSARCGTWDRLRAARRLEQIWVADWLFAGVNPPIDFY